MNINFANKTVLITGGTRGIGKATVDLFVSLGAEVIYTGRNKQEQTAADTKSYYKVDFSIKKSVDKFIENIRNKDIDILVNNAGINSINPVSDFKDSDWDDIMAVNLTAPYKIIKEVATQMKKRGGGKIVNISSIYSIVGKSNRAGYCSSKFGIRGLTVAVAAELAEHNILVNAIAPGFTLTDLTVKVLGLEGIKRVAETVPMKRLANPDEIAKTIAFLASDFNTYISGQTIVVDGGFVNV